MKQSDAFGSDESAARLVAAAESLAAGREWTAADERFRRAITIDPTAASRIAYGTCLSHQERFFEAIQALTPLLEGTDRDAVGIVCHNLAAIYRDVGEYELARRFQWKATLMQADSGPEELLGMANDAYCCERHDAAESLVMSAIEIDSDEDLDADLIATTGLIHAQLASPREALLTLYMAYQRHQAEANFQRMGIDQLNLSLLFGELKRYRAQRTCLKRAIRWFERAPAPYSLQRARQLLARCDQMRSVRSFNGQRN